MDNLNQYLHIRESTVDIMVLTSIQVAVESLRSGHPILILDDEIEGEGDVCIPAQIATPQAINFMVTACRGIVCQPITSEIASRLDLPLMVPNGGSPAFTISVDAVGVGSGTSAYDRSYTARMIANPDTTTSDLIKPGHIFPIISRQGGVLERAGHTEASSDIVQLAGFLPSTVICEVMDDYGHMAGVETLRKFAQRYNMPIITIRDIIEFRRHFDDRVITFKNTLLEQPLIEDSKRGNGRHK